MKKPEVREEQLEKHFPLNPKKNRHTLPVDTKAQNGGVAVLKAVVNTYWNIATNAD